SSSSSSSSSEPGRGDDGPAGCADLPVYPKADVFAQANLEAAQLMDQLEEMGGYGVIRVYRTKDDGADVHAWYKEAMADDGWDLTMELAMGDQGLFIWEKGTLSAQVVTGPEDGETAIIVGCGDTEAIAAFESQPSATRTPVPTPTMDVASGDRYGQGEAFSYADATLEIIGFQELGRIAKFGSDDAFYQADQGKYVVVAFSFQGETDDGTLDYALFRLTDDQGRVYAMDTDTYSQECSALANTHGYDYLMHWNDGEPSEALLVFDVPADATGLSLALLPEEDARVADVVVELTSPMEIVPDAGDAGDDGDDDESAQGGGAGGDICGAIPSYGEATLASVDEITSGALIQQLEDMGRINEVYVYRTQDDPSLIKDHYAQAMQDAGWSLTFEMTVQGDVLMIWAKDGNMAQLVIGNDDGKTTFILGCGPNG
ncbi:MAG: hypothetical protein ACP5G7_12385, partial [Anaerolineae bacterium]